MSKQTTPGQGRRAPVGAALEEQLRRLPPPPVPATLERRLLDAIPLHDCGARRRGAGWRGAAAGAAVAAAVVAAFRLLSPQPNSPQSNSLQSNRGGPTTNLERSTVQNDTAPGGILPHADLTETRPCDILPPLPFSS
jgi:hypothetical protein